LKRTSAHLVVQRVPRERASSLVGIGRS